MTSAAAAALPRSKRALPGLLFGLLVVGVYADPLFFRRNFAGRDLLAYGLPIEKGVHEAWRRGAIPVWSEEISGGRPLLPNPNAGAFYPVRPLLSLLPFPAAMRLFPVLHWLAAGLGVLSLLRSLGASRAGSWIGAVTYAFSGVGITEVFFPAYQPGMTLLPWVVAIVARPARSPASRILPLSVVLGLSFLAGDVFTVSLAFAAALLWILLEADRAERIRSIGSVLAAAVLAAFLAAPQIVATALWVPETTRAVLGLTLGQAFFLSLSPMRLLELIVPFPFGETWSLEDDIWAWPVFDGLSVGFFSTLYCGAFAFIGLVVLRRERQRGVRFARWLLGLGALLSALPSLTPDAWKQIRSPVALRIPEKFAVAVALALAILAGLAWDLLRRSQIRRRWPLAVGVGLTIAALAAAVAPGAAGRIGAFLVGAGPGMDAKAGAYLPAALAEGGLLWASAVLALALLRTPGPAASAAALALITAAPILANRRIARSFREAELFAPTAFARIVHRNDPHGAYRTLGESIFRPATRELDLAVRSDDAQLETSRRGWYDYAQVIWDRGTVLNGDLDRGDLSRVSTLRRIGEIASRSSRSAAFFGNLSLRYGIRYRGQAPLSGYRRFGGDALQDFDHHAAAYPDIRLAERWSESPGGTRALNEIGRMGPGEVLVESGRERRGSARAGLLRIVEKRPERFVAEARTADPTWLFVLRAFWSHRTVLLDGRPVGVFPAQLAFSAVPIPAGAHRIEWTERVPGGAVSRWGPVLFLLVAAGLWTRGRRR